MAAAKHEKKEPLLRMSRRNEMKTGKKWAIRIVSILVALMIGAVLFIGLGYSPFSVYGSMLQGSLGGKLAIQQTIKIAIPLLGASLAIAPAFRMRFWNIGVEGQITMGAIFSTFFALNFYDSWPAWLLLLVMCIAGAVGGALWGLIPAVFRAKWGTNETLFTLMMNYIAIGIVKYLQGGPWEKKTQRYPADWLVQRCGPDAHGLEYYHRPVFDYLAGVFHVLLLEIYQAGL